ncbi:MAG: GNAT family protein [Actinomycetaceae bacterium]|nr:GNAT family protein [Actinomycetaceae bacterium]
MTSTLRLRPLRAGDAEAVLDAFASAPDMARQGAVGDLAQAREYVERLADPASDVWAVAVCEGDRLAGLVCIGVDADNLLGWFWYWMTASRRGRGWTSLAARSVANWALSDGGLERLELGHRVNNPASAGVAAAAGFVLEGWERAKFLVDGERIDVLTYGRLRSDPVPAGPVLAVAGAAWRVPERRGRG